MWDNTANTGDRSWGKVQNASCEKFKSYRKIHTYLRAVVPRPTSF